MIAKEQYSQRTVFYAGMIPVVQAICMVVILQIIGFQFVVSKTSKAPQKPVAMMTNQQHDVCTVAQTPGLTITIRAFRSSLDIHLPAATAMFGLNYPASGAGPNSMMQRAS